MDQNTKKEVGIVDEKLENLYKDHLIKDELVIGPEIIQEDDNGIECLDQDVELVDENIGNSLKDKITRDKLAVGPEVISKKADDLFKDYYVIKKELIIDPEFVQDEEFQIEYLDEGVKMEVEDTDNFIHIVKNEPITKREIILNEEVTNCSDSDKMFDIVIKEKLNEQDFLQSEEIVDQCLKKEVDHEETEDLYKDHTVKDELVIGPEPVQDIANLPSYTTKLPKKDLGKSKSKLNGSKSSSFVNDKVLNIHKSLFTCDYCQKSFDNRANIKQHLKVHDRPKYKCHICGKHSTFPSNLARHLKIHTGVKRFSCPHCKLSFTRKDYLAIHIRKRHGIMQFENNKPDSTCDLCNKVFSTKCSRDYHRKYSCPVIKNRVNPRKNKLYECDVCQKSYPYRTSLTAHIKRCHSNLSIGPLHECDFCGKKYVKKHNLQCHIQSKHLNVQPYRCKICKETFTWHSTLAMHERRVHGKVKKMIYS